MTARAPAVLIDGRITSLPSGDHIDPGSGGTLRTPLVMVDGRVSELAPADSIETSSGGSSHVPLVLIDGHVARLPAGDSIVTAPTRSLVSRGQPVTSSRQFCPSLSPNPTNTGWNYIVASFTGVDPNPVEWVVIQDLTTVPDVHIYDTTTHEYPNQLFSLASLNQLRAQNGRIFFPLFANNFAVYRPDTEDVIEFGPFVESPPVDPNASTIPYSASFDTSGILYFATQESQNRPSCLVTVDPDTLAITVIGYFGDSAADYTTYGYYVAPDTGTATKGVWAVYGQTKWQLWFIALDGTATKHYEVDSTGHIAFRDIPGQGWVAQIHTNANQSDDEYTQWWCLADPTNLNGALYTYTEGDPPPGTLARDVTPLENPLTSPPELDTSHGIGAIGWRPNSSSDPFTYVDYGVTYTAPVPIEMIASSPDGVLIGAQQYQGFVRYVAASHTGTWFGAQSGNTIAQPLALYVSALDRIFLAGYPDGTLLEYDPTSAWDTFPSEINPALDGFYGPSGNQKAGIKYAGYPAPPSGYGAIGKLVWAAAAGTSGRLYCAGTRERTGSGAGIGYWDKSANTIDGTFASPLDTVQPLGLVGLDAISRIAMSTKTLSGFGPSPLYVFDYDLDLVDTQFPLDSTFDNIGQIFPTGDTQVICGAYSTSGGNLALYRWNVQTGTIVQSVTTPYNGAIDATTINQADGSIWIALGNSLVRVDPDTLAVTREVDITSIAPVSCLAFYGTEIYMSSSATLWSS